MPLARASVRPPCPRASLNSPPTAAPLRSPARASGSAIAGKGLGDLDVVRLNAEDGSSAEVYLFGGVVTSFKPKGGDDVLYVRPDAKFDKSKPISGGLPHCA